jgi:L-2-hydroxyglutarate oxidase LhgO
MYRRPDLKTVVIDKESEVAMHTTGRNTGVLHCGVLQGMGDEFKTTMIKDSYAKWD